MSHSAKQSAIITEGTYLLRLPDGDDCVTAKPRSSNDSKGYDLFIAKKEELASLWVFKAVKKDNRTLYSITPLLDETTTCTEFEGLKLAAVPLKTDEDGLPVNEQLWSVSTITSDGRQFYDINPYWPGPGILASWARDPNSESPNQLKISIDHRVYLRFERVIYPSKLEE